MKKLEHSETLWRLLGGSPLHKLSQTVADQHFTLITVKVLNFWTPKMFAVIILKFEQTGLFHREICHMANSVEPDQTAPRVGAV